MFTHNNYRFHGNNIFFIQLLIISSILLLFIDAKTIHNSTTSHPPTIAVIKWEFHEFSTHITVMLFLIILVCLKLAYHYSPYISAYVPESLLLIIIGITFGSIVLYDIEKQSNNTIENTVWKFTPQLFAYYLLPPIILESAYNLYNRTFSEYLGIVLLFSVLGTICNFLLIGFSMYFLYKLSLFGEPTLQYDVKGYLLFSSIIVAVDPVAVLAIFQDIGVELSLYFIVFGESLFNDAITIVLNDIMIAFTSSEQVTSLQIFIGFISFFTVSFGGLLIGVIFGVFTCLITRIHSHLAVFTILLLAYFSYIMADCVGWSGIISMIACGLVQAAYAFHNIGEKYVKSVHLITRMLAEVSEAVIFLFLGIQVISYKLEWHTGFILWGLVLCLISRAIVVFSITAIVNYVNIDETKITLAQQIVLIYGGLRGAVAFALAVLIPEDLFPVNGLYHKNVIVTATLFIILFTVGFMGLTTKPLVKLLKIRKKDKETLSLFHILNKSIIDQTLTGIETLTGSKGRNAIREFCMRIDEKYIRRILQRNPERYDEKILKVYEHIALKLLYASTRPKETENILKNIPESLKLNQINQYSRNNIPTMLNGTTTQDWIVRNNLSVIQIYDDDDADEYVHGNHHNDDADDVDVDDEGTLGEGSFISAGQMIAMNAHKKQYRKMSINPNDLLFDQLTRNNHLPVYSSTISKHNCPLDFNEAFSDLLHSRFGTMKHQQTPDNNNNNNNVEMNTNHIDQRTQHINNNHHDKTNSTRQSLEDDNKHDSHSEQHNHPQHSSHSSEPEIIDYRKRHDLTKNIK
ncbi:unnamed protein product [Schistosoma turkestanicum]|nr:unnamed protein product [Schistosoma turkestanicum]